MTQVENLTEAVQEANEREWVNGMSTKPVTVEREGYNVRVCRKCGSLERPEIILFTVAPDQPNELELIDYDELGSDILEAMELDLYGDLKVDFHDHETKKTVIIENTQG